MARGWFPEHARDQGCVTNWGSAPALVEADVSKDSEDGQGLLVH